MTRSLNDIPAASAQSQNRSRCGIEAIDDSQTGPSHFDCVGTSVGLLGFVATELSKLPGRRVILVVTDGRDRGVRTWNEVRSYTQAAGVAVFGMVNTAITPGWSNILWAAHHNDASISNDM